MMRTSTECVLAEPTGRTSFSCSTRRSLAWRAGGSSAISSRNSVPPWAERTRPSASATAPENAPRPSVDRGGHQLLAGSALALDQDWGVRGRHRGDRLLHLPHLR